MALPLTVSEVKEMSVADLRAELSSAKLSKTLSMKRLITALEEEDHIDRSSGELDYEWEPREDLFCHVFRGATTIHHGRCYGCNTSDSVRGRSS